MVWKPDPELESLNVKLYRKTSTKLSPDAGCGASRGPTSRIHINTATSGGWAVPAAQPDTQMLLPISDLFSFFLLRQCLK